MKSLISKSITHCMGLLFISSIASAQIVDKNNLVAQGAEIVKLGNGYSFTEGPVSDRKGNVFFTDQPNNKIIRWDASSKEFSTFSDQSGRANGMFFDKKGNLITCSDEENQLWSFDKKGNHTVLVKEFDQKQLNGPNDIWIDPKGGMYLTDPLYPRNYWKRSPEMQQPGQYIYYLAPNKKNLIKIEDSLVKPNGIIGSADGKHLYIADIGDNKTYHFDILENGMLANKQLFAKMGSDGITLDQQGNVYLTGKGVTVFDPKGNQIGHFPIPEGWTANVCFGGKNRDLLFITAGPSVYSLQMNVKGIKPY